MKNVFSVSEIRRIIYLMIMFSVEGILLFRGNMDVAFAVIPGSIFMRLFLIHGIQYLGMQGGYPKEKKKYGIKQLTEQLQNQPEDIFLALVMIVALFCVGNFFQNQSSRTYVMNQWEGIVLLLVGMLYFVSLLKNVEKEYLRDRKEKIAENLIKKILFVVVAEIIILPLSYVVVELALSKLPLLPYIVGIVVIPVYTNIVNVVCYQKMDMSRKWDIEQEEFRSGNEAIFFMTIVMGAFGIIAEIHLNSFSVYDMILFSLASVLYIFRKKTDSRFAGCGMLAVYSAIIIYILIR